MQETLRERRRRGRLRAVGADDCELVAAEPRDKSTFAGSLQADGDLPQQRVADRMAEHVVDVLEAVEVDADHREILLRHRRALERRIEALVEGRAIGQIRQCIVMGKVLDCRLGAPALGDVLDDVHDIAGRAVGAAYGYSCCGGQPRSVGR